MPQANKKIILFEYDKPVDLADVLPVESGIFGWRVYNTTTSYTDAHGVTGYYSYVQTIRYQVQSVKVASINFSKVTTLANLRATDNSFLYNTATGMLYIHIAGFEPPLSKTILYGVSQGFSLNAAAPYFAGFLYEPRLKKVPAIKRSIDAFFFGLLKYQAWKPTLINNDGYFDDWRARNLYGQHARVLIGDPEDAYEDFTTVFDGFIENDSRDFSDFSVSIQDTRKSLTQPVATRTLKISDYPYLADNDKGQVLPIAYGPIYNAKAYCTNSQQSAPGAYHFKFLDTAFHACASVSLITVEGVDKTSLATLDLAGGGFSFSSSVINSSNFDTVLVTFTAGTITGAQAIVLDLMVNHNGTSYNSDFWDVSEVNPVSSNTGRETSLYIDDNASLATAIESVCNDGDLRFFQHDDGRYTIRIYNADRTPVVTINDCDWLGGPSFENTGSDFLSSVIIKYHHDVDADTYYTYENTAYQAAAYDRYKKLNSKTYETRLTTEAAAIERSNTIMSWSSDIKDIITRSASWSAASTLEITDFIIASPHTRLGATQDWGIYEVLGVEKDIEKMKVKLTMVRVKDYTAVEYRYKYRVIDSGAYRITSDGKRRVIREVK